MSASDEVWILGIRMTKFGKHPDLDAVDLAAQAATGALSDAGVTMADEVLQARRGCLVGEHRDPRGEGGVARKGQPLAALRHVQELVDRPLARAL